jgi:hypothetical protein
VGVGEVGKGESENESEQKTYYGNAMAGAGVHEGSSSVGSGAEKGVFRSPLSPHSCNASPERQDALGATRHVPGTLRR